ncbi:methyltransferase domain-containing protein [Puia dinghuensis]|uniref:Methyltransferase domain-containing protein n=1 Tax=Puia dinghuensis TaxID=1792502 RepID=A0A8J2UBS1_9BACT|nr:methyltransferase domain-containing protein [Puia dinghuensis]GGA94633.1 hypothetical protein GCM10011511_17400 [Puia dinghuensis]
MPAITDKSRHLDDWFVSDIQFNLLYPPSMQALARMHWTPLAVIKSAAEFLATRDGSRILDIGSGVGKFCLSASYYQPNALFAGVEQRNNLVGHAVAARSTLGLRNVSFVAANFTQLDFSHYDHFYFYNSFFENLGDADRIDDSIQYSSSLYHYYSNYLRRELGKMPAGTRIVTYCSWQDEIPPSYELVQTDLDGLLKYNVKTRD